MSAGALRMRGHVHGTHVHGTKDDKCVAVGARVGAVIATCDVIGFDTAAARLTPSPSPSGKAARPVEPGARCTTRRHHHDRTPSTVNRDV